MLEEEEEKNSFTDPLESYDELTVARIRSILRKEFDIEIRNKLRDLELVEERLKCANLLFDLINRIQKDISDEFGGSTPRKRSSFRNEGLERSSEHANDSTRGGHLFSRTADGAFLKLVCPSCHRSKFLNKLGFVNHCRIMHKLKFASHEDASLHCGVLVEEDSVPPDDPSRVERSLDFLLSQYQLHQRKRQKCSISSSSSSSEPPSSINETPKVFSGKELEKDTESQSGETEIASRNSSLEVPNGRIYDENGPVSNPGVLSSEISGECARKEKKKTSNLTMRSVFPLDRSLVFANLSSSETSHISRFYVRKRIVVGNVSKHLRKEIQGVGEAATHKWMVYVKGSSEEPDKGDISYYVKKVRFFLDASFKPNDIVEVNEAPFQITRKGWGEFPIRVQLHFVDQLRNKPINIVHPLKLDKTCTGLQTFGGETVVDIELDREFFLGKELLELDDIRKPKPFLEPNEAIGSSIVEKRNSTEILSSLMVSRCLTESLRQYPLVASDAALRKLPFRSAKSFEEWLQWDSIKRKAIEVSKIVVIPILQVVYICMHT